MRIDCPCGARIKDQTDDLPHKAHLIPDQDWFGVFDAIDAQVIEPLVEGRLEPRIARSRFRHLISRPAGLVYQCAHCGRLFVYSHDGRELHRFVPESDRTGRAVLRGRPKAD